MSTTTARFFFLLLMHELEHYGFKIPFFWSAETGLCSKPCQFFLEHMHWNMRPTRLWHITYMEVYNFFKWMDLDLIFLTWICPNLTLFSSPLWIYTISLTPNNIFPCLASAPSVALPLSSWWIIGSRCLERNEDWSHRTLILVFHALAPIIRDFFGASSTWEKYIHVLAKACSKLQKLCLYK